MPRSQIIIANTWPDTPSRSLSLATFPFTFGKMFFSAWCPAHCVCWWWLRLLFVGRICKFTNCPKPGLLLRKSKSEYKTYRNIKLSVSQYFREYIRDTCIIICRRQNSSSGCWQCREGWREGLTPSGWSGRRQEGSVSWSICAHSACFCRVFSQECLPNNWTGFS